MAEKLNRNDEPGKGKPSKSSTPEPQAKMTDGETSEGGVQHLWERIRAIKTLGDDRQNDYLDEDIVITRLASEDTEGDENSSFSNMDRLPIETKHFIIQTVGWKGMSWKRGDFRIWHLVPEPNGSF
ncbi:hypothetical protein PG996_008713 [Apiospora saccharicola]|uniref:Uncharacterized protein n=1 Tax=Apiospora saccharicola TaxID=335842 RepID=A0ABR1UYQ9_9PEZI